MNISIIVPNYNGARLLKENLPKVIKSLTSYKNGQIELIIADDSSQDESVKVIKQISKSNQSNVKIRLMENEKNYGFPRTVNKAVASSIGEMIILLNTDVYPEGNFLEPLLLNFKNEKIFAAGCMDKSIEKEKTVLRGRGVGEWKRGFLMHGRGDINKKNTLWASGGSGAFRKSIWEKLGGFNELYSPFYWEDIDLSYRAWKSGYQVIFEPKSVVIHEHLRGSINTHFSKFKIKTIAYRNQFIFVWTNITDFDLQLSSLLWLPYHLLKGFFRWDISFFAGFFGALILIPNIIKSSFRYQRYFIKKDKDILSMHK